MMSLFDEDQIMKIYVESERREAAEKAAKKAEKAAQSVLKKTAINMVKLGKISLDEVTSWFPDISDETMKEIEKEVL